MIFGNSKNNGNKRDVKYLTKREKENRPILYQDAADGFKLWFGDNYTNIIEECKQKNILNEDVINDAFIRLYELQQYKGCIIEYRSYFFRALYTNFFQHNMKKKRSNEMHNSINILSKYENDNSTFDSITSIGDKLIDTTESDIEEYNEKQDTDKAKVDKLFQYVYNNFPLVEFEIFKIYFRCKPHFSYKKLSLATGLSISFIADTIKKIKQEIKQNKEFIFQ